MVAQKACLMPTYTYRCLRNDTHTFDKFETINRRDEIQSCPECGFVSKRIIATAPAVVYRGNDWTRKEGRQY